MSQQRWTADQCAAHAGIATSTWRDYVADHRAPAPLPGYDPDTGRKTWDPATVRAWHTQRPGQGARTDLTYLPGTNGQPVFINPTTITTATLLRDLTSAADATLTTTALKQHWAQQFPDDNQTPSLPQHITNAPTTRQINKALNALQQLGAIHLGRHQITITNHDTLTHIANTKHDDTKSGVARHEMSRDSVPAPRKLTPNQQ